MKVHYLASLYRGVEHPVFCHLVESTGEVPANCYLVEVSTEAGVEGDLLVVDEARPVQHADLEVVDTGECLRLFRSHRIGGGLRLLPESGGQGTGPIRRSAAGWSCVRRG